MSNSLFDLALGASHITEKLIESGGEISTELEAVFDDIGTQLATKVDSYSAIIDRLDVEAEFFKSRADAYLKVSKSCKALKDRLNTNIKAAMVMMDTDEIKGEEMRFKLSKLAPKIVIDEAALPSNFKMVVTETVPDKSLIKDAVEAGEEIPGVTREEVFSLRKYLNRGAK